MPSPRVGTKTTSFPVSPSYMKLFSMALKTPPSCKLAMPTARDNGTKIAATWTVKEAKQESRQCLGLNITQRVKTDFRYLSGDEKAKLLKLLRSLKGLRLGAHEATTL